MKLSKKLVQKWKNQCRDEAMRVTGDYIDLEQLAELAAVWGAEQSLDGKRLHDYDTRLSAVMPADFKDWHQNSKAEWPEIAAGVITNQREHIDFYIEDLKRKDAEIERKDALLRDIREWMDRWQGRSTEELILFIQERNQLRANIKTELGGNHG